MQQSAVRNIDTSKTHSYTAPLHLSWLHHSNGEVRLTSCGAGDHSSTDVLAPNPPTNTRPVGSAEWRSVGPGWPAARWRVRMERRLKEAMVYRLVAWLVAWLLYWLVAWLVAWLVYWLMYWLVYCQMYYLDF